MNSTRSAGHGHLPLLGPGLALLSVLLSGQFAWAESPVPESLSFTQHVRPILSDKCFACHGFDESHREADLRLDDPQSATEERGGIQAITPGDLEASEVWRRIISTDPYEVMPPAETNKPLTDDERAILRAWISQGAPYQQHWSFEPPQKHQPPTVESPPRNAIDAFIRQPLERQGLELSPEADPATLIRRVAFALTGLPPTPAEVEAFCTDPSEEAYEEMVDHYLSSPHFGEEMARHWLDVARYADTHGLHLDNERQMWAYRDWVIEAFNRNLPFDQFTLEQLAGDLLPEPTQAQLVATGFNRCNVTTSEGGSIAEEFVYRYAVDRASTTAEAWMGLTAGCAACHDHKFDPLSQREFYSLYAFFHSAADPAMDGNALLTEPTLKLIEPEQEQQLADLATQIDAARGRLEAAVEAIDYTDPATLDPPAEVQSYEAVWLEDEFPAGAKVQFSGHETEWTTADAGPVHSGNRALRRKADGVAQDFYHGGAELFEIPAEASFFIHVWLAPEDAPQSVMLQFHTDTWKHRAVWGDYEAINFGSKGTTQRVHKGELPETGRWVRLEASADELGLSAGDQITGFAMTQFAGTVYWDRFGVAGRSDPAADPRRSFLAWRKDRVGKETEGVPADLNALLKQGPDQELESEPLGRLHSYYLQNVCLDTAEQLAPQREELTTLEQQRDQLDASIPSTFIFKDLPQPRESFVMLRGAYDQPGEKVEPNVPAFLPPLQQEDSEGRPTRLDLARWLVAPEHPLTARVAVNRFWQQIFGDGLVRTSGDFGSQGEAPTHPELLDWLAVTFREGGWDMKGLVRLLVTSDTFRQSSAVTPELLRKDPENRLYARGPRFRLDAEQLRDNALFVSGLINLQMGGKGVRPYQPPNIWEPVGFVGSNTRFYEPDSGPDLYRRSIYVFLKRTAPPPFMSNFDGPNREQSCVRRERSNTPLQALQLMNDVQHFEAARALAERMVREGGSEDARRVRWTFRTVLAREPDAEEQAIVLEQLAAARERYAADAEAAGKVVAQGDSEPDPELSPIELAATTLVANLILNLDETLTRN